MNVIRHTDAAFAATIRSLTTQSSLLDPTIEERTRVIDLYADDIRSLEALIGRDLAAWRDPTRT